MLIRLIVCLLLSLTLAAGAYSQEHSVEVIKKAPPKDELAKEMQDQFADQGFKVIRGSSRTVCEIWPCKTWDTQPDFTPKEGRLYPFSAGQLIGLLHFQRRGKDFRDQTINSGWYTLRFGLQPTDGNHVGTSPTRDFLLMIPAAEDKSPEPVGVKRLMQASAEAAGTSHPAMLCLQPLQRTDAKKEPSMRHDEDKDWWILHFTGNSSDEKKTELGLDVIVVGHADE